MSLIKLHAKVNPRSSLLPPPSPPPPGVTYLDHAGTALYSRAQLQSHFSDLTANLYGNPHSQNPSSSLTTDKVDHVRELVLRHFNTSSNEYDLVFTSGCTGALKLLSESFPWSRGGGGGQLEEGHIKDTSVPTATLMGTNEIHSPEKAVEAEVEERVRKAKSSYVPLKWVSTAEVLYTPDLVHGSRNKRNGCVGRGETHNSTEENICSCLSSHSSSSVGGSTFCYLEDNHTSVVGMREEAGGWGARIVCATEHEIVTCARKDGLTTCDRPPAESGCTYGNSSDLRGKNDSRTTFLTNTDGSPLSSSNSTSLPLKAQGPFHLFAFPAQSNFSGRKYPMNWALDIPNGKLCIAGLCQLGGSWKVLIDAAAYVSTSSLDLSAFPADFVVISFYKVFGFPTGLGALLVRKDSAHLLQKRFYGGGTVLATVSRSGFHIPRPQLHDRWVGQGGYTCGVLHYCPSILSLGLTFKVNLHHTVQYKNLII